MDSPIEKQQHLPPAGWYPDPSGSGQNKWWDGTGWTETEWEARSEHPPTAKGPRPVIGAQAPVYNPFIWILLTLPIALRLLVIGIDSAPLDPEGISNALWVAFSMAVSYVAMVVMGYWDWRSLRNAGVVRPFHWGWAFLPSIYAIGRTVIVRQVAPGRGLAPISLIIADFLIGLTY